MDSSCDTPVELLPLEQRRAELRALSDDIMDVIKTLPKPTTWLEGDRAMRCLGTADRVTVQLFTKVRAHAPSEPKPMPALSLRQAAPVSAPDIPDDGIDDADMLAEDSDGGKGLDAALDDIETFLDAIDRGDTPALARRPALPAANITAATSRDTPYQNLAQTLARGRDLIMELNAAPP